MTTSISAEEVLALHKVSLEAFGGMPGVRDAGAIQSAISQPHATFGGQELYPSVNEKAAALGLAIIANHLFVDGNKRTGFLAMDIFLRRNGWHIACATNEGEQVVLGVATGEIQRDELSAWIESHLQKLE